MNLPLQVFGHGNCKGLWLHGWLGSGAEGQVLQQGLGPDFELRCPDLPGHGASPLAGWTLTSSLKAIADAAANCQWAGGYSMGGRLLMMSAARHPEAFQKLVIESASLGLANEKERAPRRERDQVRSEELKTKGLSAFCEVWYQMEMWGGWQGFPPRQGDPAALARALALFSLGRQPDLRSWIKTTPCRILWLAGQKDAAYAQQAVWVKSRTRHQVSLLDAGHNVHLQQPEQWAEVLKVFLRMPPGECAQ